MISSRSHGRSPVSDAPSELGGYRLVELLGRGGMGEVWRAERLGPGGIRRRAAVKRMLPHLRNDPVLRERFVTEARINARLEHPNIVQVLDFGDQPEPFLVLEYVEGISAAELLKQCARTGVRLPAVAAAFIAAEIASGLDYAHRKRDEQGRPLGIVHRDVSPHNVLISTDGAVKLTDFGVARAVDNRIRTQHGASIGKLVYMAPEQALGEPVDARSDVFALGVVLWEMLTLSPLLPRDAPAAALEMLQQCAFKPPSQVDPRLPAVLDDIVMPALARDPAARYQSAGAFAQAIRSFIHSVSPGFDSHELVRILGGLLPSVPFQTAAFPMPSPTPSLRNETPGQREAGNSQQGDVGAAPSLGQPNNIAPEPVQRKSPQEMVTPPPELPMNRGLPWGAFVIWGAVMLVGAMATGGLVLWKRVRNNGASHVVQSPVRVEVPSPPAGFSHPIGTVVPVTSVGAASAELPLHASTGPDAATIASVPVQSVSKRRSGSNRRALPADIADAGANHETAIDVLQREIASLRELVGACLGANTRSGCRVRVSVVYDGPRRAVDDVRTEASGLTVGPSEAQCVLATLRNAVHVSGIDGKVTVYHQYQY